MTETGAWGDEPESSEAAKKRFPTWAKLVIALCLCAFSIACIGLLATLLLPNLVRQLVLPNEVKAKADIVVLRQALDSYAIEHAGRYPESLEALVVPDAGGVRFLDVDQVPLDPWKRPYGYQAPGGYSSEPRIFTLGADGQPGGEGQDRDIDNLLIRQELREKD